MDLQLVCVWPIGHKGCLVVGSTQREGDYFVGFESPHRECVALKYEGTLDTCVSLYNVIKTNEKFGHAFVVQLDPILIPLHLGPHIDWTLGMLTTSFVDLGGLLHPSGSCQSRLFVLWTGMV